jgi:hypothetical protein
MYERGLKLLLTWLSISAESAYAQTDVPTDTEQRDVEIESVSGRAQVLAQEQPDWAMLSPLSAVRSVAVDGFLPNVVYASAEGGRYVSFDFGQRWLHTSDDGGELFADPNRPGAAFADVEGTLAYTKSAGLNWDDIGSLPGRLLAVAPGDSDVLWANEAIFLLKSSDRGRSWARVPFPGPGSCCDEFVALTVRDVYASAFISQLSRSYDGGATWPLSTFADLYFVSSFAVSPRRPDVLYAGAAQADPVLGLTGLRKSVDGGRSWFAPSPEFEDARVGELALSSADGRLYMNASSSDDPDRFSVFVSADGGAHFAAAGVGLPAASVSQLIPHPTLRCSAFAIAEGRLYRTTNAGGSCW